MQPPDAPEMHSIRLLLEPHMSRGYSATGLAYTIGEQQDSSLATHMTLPLSAGLPPPFVMADLTSPVQQSTQGAVSD
jgi:hypothetical protein